MLKCMEIYGMMMMMMMMSEFLCAEDFAQGFIA